MVVPKYNELYNDVFYVLSDGKEHNHRELTDTVADNISLTNEDKLKTIKSGSLLYQSKIGWSRTYLKQVGLVESRRRNYSNITKEGLRVFNSGVFVDNDYLRKYDSFRDFIQRQRKTKTVKNIENKSDNLMIICANCGKENIRSSKFCGYCGSKIDENQIYVQFVKQNIIKLTDMNILIDLSMEY